MTYAFVTTNLLDLWDKPHFNSERLNQAFYATPMKVLKSDRDYRLLEDPGGYTGWAHENGLLKISQRDYRSAVSNLNGVVTSASGARLLDPRRNEPCDPFFAYYGTRLTVTSWRTPYLTVRLPDGETRRVKHGKIKPMKDKKAPKVTGRHLVNEARRFLGIPYLWGGITNAGFDCSGLVYTVCARFGIVLPRDTKDQISAGKPIRKDAVSNGDLMFFDRHVGFAIGPNRLIHSSVAGTGVRINSLNPEEPDFREDLARTYREARRIL